MDLYLEAFEVATLVERGRRRPSRPLWRRTATRCASSCRRDLGAMHADLTKVRQSLFNLLSQRRQFTERGHDHAARSAASDGEA